MNSDLCDDDALQEMPGPLIGEWVCTCQLIHEQIVEVADDNDTIVTASGWRCSYIHCCDPIDHEWSHDDVVAGAESPAPPNG